MVPQAEYRIADPWLVSGARPAAMTFWDHMIHKGTLAIQPASQTVQQPQTLGPGGRSSFIRTSEQISRGTVTGRRNSMTRFRISYHPSRTSEHSSVGAAKRRESVRMFG